MKRVVVIGNNGTGKSVFSTRLGKKLNLPIIHLDTFFHTTGWKRVTDEEWDKIHAELVSQDVWIMDGTYRRTLPLRIKRADTIFFLDLPKKLAFYRMIKRRIISRNKKRPGRSDSQKEQISLILFRKNISFSNKRIYQIIDEFRDTKNIIVFKKTKDIEDFLNA